MTEFIVRSLPHLSSICLLELAPLYSRTGCRRIVGPDSSPALDKEKLCS